MGSPAVAVQVDGWAGADSAAAAVAALAGAVADLLVAAHPAVGDDMNFLRILRHLFAEGSGRRHFPPVVLDAIQRAIADGEKHHAGQLCFAIEGALPFAELLRGRNARDRAHDVFAHLRVWDTEHNSGVLIYVLLPDRAIEIVADRGIAARVGQSAWQSACDHMRDAFAAGDYERGACAGVNAVSAILAEHFPATGPSQSNELPDRPVML